MKLLGHRFAQLTADFWKGGSSNALSKKGGAAVRLGACLEKEGAVVPLDPAIRKEVW